jgi:hypothetical protein
MTGSGAYARRFEVVGRSKASEDSTGRGYHEATIKESVGPRTSRRWSNCGRRVASLVPSDAQMSNGSTFSREPREQTASSLYHHLARIGGCNVLLGCLQGEIP